MKKFDLPFWKDAPFIRILLPFIAGIAVTYYSLVTIVGLTVCALACVAGLAAFSKLKIHWQYQYTSVRGLLFNILIGSIGAYLAAEKNPFRYKGLVEKCRDGPLMYVASLGEPPLEKKSSWKSLSALVSLQCAGKAIDGGTNIILYFKKDSSRPPPVYGSKVAFSKQPDSIKNFITGSSFDYQRYCALKNIHYQVFLKADEYEVLKETEVNALQAALFDVQRWTLGILRANIKGIRECGLAEALLIGYKNNLDRDLLQAYSNTGVVHVVAISGLHLGLIYAMLNMFCRPLANRKIGKVLQPVIVLSGLWMFSFLAGASPSVLRSAVMFSFVVIGNSVSKRSSLLNNLAASAFVLLCYDPYWLWDLGFILSYGALLSISIFMKPIYSLYVTENKLLDGIWKMNAVTLSAQVITMPVLIYYFGQFPTLFLFTNFVAIPLSGIILIGEIVLCAVYFVKPVATFCGRIVESLIRLMNAVVEYFNSFSFSTISGLEISMVQLVLLYVIILFIADRVKSWQ